METFAESSQLHLWTLQRPEHLTWLRNRANYTARCALSEAPPPLPTTTSSSLSQDETIPETSSSIHNNSSSNGSGAAPSIHSFARGWIKRFREGQEGTPDDYEAYPTQGPLTRQKPGQKKPHPYLTAAEEATLVQFYAPTLNRLVGSQSLIPRYRASSKVLVTASLLYRRFFLSNSVHMHDPKAILVAAAFLACKVEDKLRPALLNHLHAATVQLQMAVTVPEILAAECVLLSGVAFDLRTLSPYPALIALTDDLGASLKTASGKTLASRTVSSHELVPLYNRAKQLLDAALLHTDVLLLFTPGQLTLATMVTAHAQLYRADSTTAAPVVSDVDDDGPGGASAGSSRVDGALVDFTLDWHAYVRLRFDQVPDDQRQQLWEKIQRARDMLAIVGDATQPPPTDWPTLKAIHKKLKRVRVWGQSSTVAPAVTSSSSAVATPAVPTSSAGGHDNVKADPVPSSVASSSLPSTTKRSVEESDAAQPQAKRVKKEED